MRHAITSSAGSADLDSLLIALYVTIDDLLDRPTRLPGRRPRLSDSELVCLAVAQVLLGCPSEHRWLRFAWSDWAISSPTCPSSLATTSDCGLWLRSSTRRSANSPARRPPGVTGCACSTPPRFPAPAAERR